jgi:hypothetical protein
MTTREAARPLRRYMRARVRAAPAVLFPQFALGKGYQPRGTAAAA